MKTWPRADHFRFYQAFSEPFFNITVELELGKLHAWSKARKVPFSHCYLYCLSRAIDAYEPMRYRIVGDTVVVTDDVVLSTVFLNDDETFRFVPLNKGTDLFAFSQSTVLAQQFHSKQPLINDVFLSRSTDLNQVYVSILPWFKFSSFSHARTARDVENGIPKFVFGKYDSITNTIPLNIEVHHGLMDGLHVAKFLTEIEVQIAKASKE
ncbi:CatA-like O-acetyltransferase [Pseudoalteromonas sp. MMG013]|uniref:CatA-like O-acetyltransferase n=1 Tax=Pseudoalteromonas sp. MMG013 TaxID=2822687 RepID=UPI001B39ABE2|nr:CatA-like O-acetyltransferase [Pseudoalteromonas sp. MMG013]